MHTGLYYYYYCSIFALLITVYVHFTFTRHTVHKQRSSELEMSDGGIVLEHFKREEFSKSSRR